MNRILIVSVAVFAGSVILYAAQNGNTNKLKEVGDRNYSEFVDKNNDGFNDNSPDHDDDGVPNGVDKDYVRGQNAKKDSSGFGIGMGNGAGNGNGWNSKNNSNSNQGKGNERQVKSSCFGCPSASSCTK